MSRAGSRRSRASGRLGAALRSVLITPADGFDAVLTDADATGRERASTYVLGLLGGASVMVLWLKIAAIADLRGDVAFTWPVFVSTLAIGGVLGVIAQVLWGWIGAGAVRLGGASASPRRMRIVWGGASFPQAIALVALVPLDLVIVGPQSYTTERLTDPLSTVWAAISLAVHISATLWASWILVRGVSVAAKLNLPAAAAASIAAPASLAGATAAAVFAASVAGVRA